MATKTITTPTLADIEAFAASIRVAETLSRVSATRRDSNAPVTPADVEGVIAAATLGRPDLRERVARILGGI
jgi:hypothetical protein